MERTVRTVATTNEAKQIDPSDVVVALMNPSL
eukprot:CAMPEP_0175000358 /NCGR_PEP_ID=MMETSP0005-20121125/2549_1 /TAXON_ID=420556 /ORGANISM="Ochromonas sp., Strain CCMP1393" /LENGTH=31 /DNA_ID= /DNA_START= /DNA_END= /DNA_ORIENTATION=